MNKKWYLAGPICHVKDESDREWRDEAKKKLECIDPFEEEIIGGAVTDNETPKDRFNRLRSENKIDLVREGMQDVLDIDLIAVIKSYGVLAYSPEPSWGTIRECALAHLLGKPVVIWTEATGWDLANTLIGVSTEIVDSFEEAIHACRRLEKI
jgi:hypothetical protein